VVDEGEEKKDKKRSFWRDCNSKTEKGKLMMEQKQF
jgi:hypothetical protein